MKLSWQRLEEILRAKVRMVEESLAMRGLLTLGNEPSVEAVARRSEHYARRDMALALLNDLREAEKIAADNDQQVIVWCCVRRAGSNLLASAGCQSIMAPRCLGCRSMMHPTDTPSPPFGHSEHAIPLPERRAAPKRGKRPRARK